MGTTSKGKRCPSISASICAAYDRGLKFEMYCRIASFRDYVLEEQDRLHVEVFPRQQDNSWVLREATFPMESIPLSALHVVLTLQEVYEGVTFLGAQPSK